MPTIPKTKTKRPWIAERKAFGGMVVNNKKFYDSKEWKRLRNAFRSANPLCINVDVCGNAMYYVDHIVPIGDGGAPLDWNNLQSLCVSCNASKTGKQPYKKTVQ